MLLLLLDLLQLRMLRVHDVDLLLRRWRRELLVGRQLKRRRRHPHLQLRLLLRLLRLVKAIHLLSSTRTVAVIQHAGRWAYGASAAAAAAAEGCERRRRCLHPDGRRLARRARVSLTNASFQALQHILSRIGDHTRWWVSVSTVCVAVLGGGRGLCCFVLGRVTRRRGR